MISARFYKNENISLQELYNKIEDLGFEPYMNGVDFNSVIVSIKNKKDFDFIIESVYKKENPKILDFKEKLID